MKKLSSIILALTALSFAAVSCQEEEIFQPGEPEESGCYGVFFPVQDASGSHTLTPADPTSVDITVKRTNASGSIADVPYVVTSSDESVFSFGSISFADGQDETTLHVDFPSAAAGATYSFTIQILDSKYASKYNDSAVALDYSFMIVEWKEFYGAEAKAGDPGHIYQVCWEEDYDTQMFYYDTAIPNLRYCKLVDAWHGNQGTADYVFYWDTKTNAVHVPAQYMQYISSDGLQVWAGDYAAFYNDYKALGHVCPNEEYFEWCAWFLDANSLWAPYYDGNGCFYLGDVTYLVSGGAPTGRGYQFGADTDADADYYLAPGFVRVDYTIDMELDYANDGVMPAYFEVGVDVASIKVAGYEGELTATQIANKVAAIEAGSEENVVEVSTEDFEADETEKVYSGAAGLKFDKSSVYTVVAVAFDAEGNAQNSVSGTQFYVAADDSEDYAVEIAAGTEAVPSRYGEYSSTSSFAYYIVGKGVEAANVTVFKAADYIKNAAEYNAALKADEDEEFALGEDAVAAINGQGGYYGIVSDLSALTEYVVVVWATNGSSDCFTTATFTTDGLPNEVLKEGTAFEYTIVLNQLFFDTEEPAFDEGLNLEFNPNTEGYEIPHWGNDVTFKFSVAEDGAISVPIQSTGITMSSYGTFAVMDAALCDTFFSEGAADYFGYDVTKKNFVDEEGNYHFYLLYASTEGYAFGVGYETLYLNGVPAAAEASVASAFAAKPSASSTYQVKPMWKSSFVGNYTNTVVRRPDNAVSMSAVNVAPKAKSSAKKSEIKFKSTALNF